MIDLTKNLLRILRNAIIRCCLKTGIGKLGDDVSGDYWKETDGSVKRALCHVLALAQMRPDGVWDIWY